MAFQIQSSLGLLGVMAGNTVLCQNGCNVPAKVNIAGQLPNLVCRGRAVTEGYRENEENTDQCWRQAGDRHNPIHIFEELKVNPVTVTLIQ